MVACAIFDDEMLARTTIAGHGLGTDISDLRPGRDSLGVYYRRGVDVAPIRIWYGIDVDLNEYISGLILIFVGSPNGQFLVGPEFFGGLVSL